MFEDISLVEPDPQTRPYDEGDYVGEEEGEISLVSSSSLLPPCWPVLTGFPAVTETAGGAISRPESPLWWRGDVDPGAPVPQEVLQRDFPPTH